VLQSRTDAEYLIKNAKSLRQSQDTYVRNTIYINADLTKVEAMTAYQNRCRRRQMAAARASSTGVVTNNGQSITVLNSQAASYLQSVDQRLSQSSTITATASSQMSAVERSAVDADNNIADSNVLPAFSSSA